MGQRKAAKMVSQKADPWDHFPVSKWAVWKVHWRDVMWAVDMDSLRVSNMAAVKVSRKAGQMAGHWAARKVHRMAAALDDCSVDAKVEKLVVLSVDCSADLLVV